MGRTPQWLRGPTLVPLVIALAPLAGCSPTALSTRDVAPTEILARCDVRASGERTAIAVQLTSAVGETPIRLHPDDRALSHDDSGVRELLPFQISGETIEGDSRVVEAYAGSFPALVAPTLAFRLNGAALKWADIAVPPPPTMELVDGEPTVVRWAPGGGEVSLFAACPESTPMQARDSSYASNRRRPVRVELAVGQDSVTLTSLEALLVPESGAADASHFCNPMHVVVVRKASVPLPLGLDPRSSCNVEQARRITVPRRGGVDASR